MRADPNRESAHAEDAQANEAHNAGEPGSGGSASPAETANADSLLAALADCDEIQAMRTDARARLAKGRGGPPGLLLTATLSLLAATFAASFLSQPAHEVPRLIYSTARGEQRQIRLADGSRIMMDAASRIIVQQTDQKRDASLVSGQARFQVAHDPLRPFVVTVAGVRVVAKGTDFNIDIGPSGALAVTLVTGRIDVSGETAASHRFTAELTPNQQLVRPGFHGTPTIGQVTASDALAWQAGRLVCNDQPLGVVIDKMNRQLTHPILLDDRRLAAMRISGVFATNQPAAFIEGATQLLGLQSRQLPDGSVLLTASK